MPLNTPRSRIVGELNNEEVTIMLNNIDTIKNSLRELNKDGIDL